MMVFSLANRLNHTTNPNENQSLNLKYQLFLFKHDLHKKGIFFLLKRDKWKIGFGEEWNKTRLNIPKYEYARILKIHNLIFL